MKSSSIIVRLLTVTVILCFGQDLSYAQQDGDPIAIGTYSPLEGFMGRADTRDTMGSQPAT